MPIGDILVAQRLVTTADLAEALERQRTEGGRLGENLVAMGKLTTADLESVLHTTPVAPRSLEETGIALPDLLNLLAKAMYANSLETPSTMAEVLKLPPLTMQQLLGQAKDRKLVDVLGSSGIRAVSELRYALTDKGKQWAQDAMALNQYIGPAPVPLAVYCERVRRQSIANELVDRSAIDSAFSNMVIAEDFVQEIGPAINSGRSILLYGPPGNGKTSVAQKVGDMFRDVIYIPYCIEVEGQIIKVFDAGTHKAIRPATNTARAAASLRREDFDQRWVPCQRPFIVTGGELTLEMLDVSFNAQARFYEAPLHIKALGGIFVIDDFGRQIVSPEALLNRWIVPLESRVDYLKLHTGKSFSLPFDELVIFSTNLAPSELMDPAFLRRIPYKIEVTAPSKEEYRQIFRAVASAGGLDCADEMVDFVITELREKNDFPLASYQPKFLVDQLRAACKFRGVPPQFRPELLERALKNLYTKDSPGHGVAPSKRPTIARAA
ncbi:MAG TPA: hypothetical protein VHT03_15715 [Rhizomicrobium sp.]|jgi:hypothetical protein|nr:hypothetical protein [Rhizomicrobium sp.]